MRHGLGIFFVLLSILVNVLRGSKKAESVIDIDKCGALDWSIFAVYVIISLTISFVAVKHNKGC